MNPEGDGEGGFVAALEALAVPAIYVSVNIDVAPAAGAGLQLPRSDL